ncbi:MAG: twin-arginine translocase subunit TatC [Dissulfurispiraceae bacterium]|jgi:sec-independent protein translocase protein TatC|nr:twin-arginine translocase subunit TatC [Dissulfurispiraceae bacterium]
MLVEKLPLTKHLQDMRKTIIVSLVSILTAFLVTFTFSEEIFRYLMFPLRYSLDFSVRDMYIGFVANDKLGTMKLVFLGPAEAFWMNIKIAFVASIVISLPVIFSQVWRFVAPGLHDKEKKYVMPFIFFATILFLFGSAFCFFIVLPFAMGFLLTYKVGDFLTPMLSVGQYADFCLKFILAFGIVFELPIVILFLTRMNIITTKTLARNRKYSVLIAFILAALLTPTPDAFNQTLMAVPIIFLYEFGILLSILMDRMKKNAGAAKEES